MANSLDSRGTRAECDSMHERANERLRQIESRLAERVFGKPHAIRQALACILADGHLLIEDLPGVGKTTLAQSLAQVMGLDFRRIQFTSDLLPSDILGVSILEPADRSFHFRPGPIFCNLVLADEINRASPRTQSALLEAMAERQVTIEGRTHILAPPFCVLATQNPADQTGTFGLPDSQLDRFLMRISLGYPPADAERQLLARRESRPVALPPLADGPVLLGWQQAVTHVATRPALVDYILRLVASTREDPMFDRGLSPRAGLALKRVAQAWAFIDGRDYVLPEDVQAVLPAVVDHRVRLRDGRHASAASVLVTRVPVEA